MAAAMTALLASCVTEVSRVPGHRHLQFDRYRSARAEFRSSVTEARKLTPKVREAKHSEGFFVKLRVLVVGDLGRSALGSRCRNSVFDAVRTESRRRLASCVPSGVRGIRVCMVTSHLVGPHGQADIILRRPTVLVSKEFWRRSSLQVIPVGANAIQRFQDVLLGGCRGIQLQGIRRLTCHENLRGRSLCGQ